MNKAKGLFVGLLVFLIGAAGGFYGGVAYQKAQTPSFAQGGPMGMAGGQRGQMSGQRGTFAQEGAGQDGQGRPVAGEIIEQDDNSVTVKLPDGSSKIVMLSAQTKISKPASGTKSDLKKGENIMAMGTESSDGTLVAETVTLGRFGFQAQRRNTNNAAQ